MTAHLSPEDHEQCQKCGGGPLNVTYQPHCLRRDCDHLFCPDFLRVECGRCGFLTTRAPLDRT